VPPIDLPIDRRSSQGPWRKGQLDGHDLGDRADGPDTDLRQLAKLDPRNRALADTRSDREIRLTKPTPAPLRPHPLADALVIHNSRIARADWLRLHSGLSAARHAARPRLSGVWRPGVRGASSGGAAAPQWRVAPRLAGGASPGGARPRLVEHQAAPATIVLSARPRASPAAPQREPHRWASRPARAAPLRRLGVAAPDTRPAVPATPPRRTRPGAARPAPRGLRA
jgi:hypothetical protein